VPSTSLSFNRAQLDPYDDRAAALTRLMEMKNEDGAASSQRAWMHRKKGDLAEAGSDLNRACSPETTRRAVR
jgi:hypothetical protein